MNPLRKVLDLLYQKESDLFFSQIEAGYISLEIEYIVHNAPLLLYVTYKEIMFLVALVCLSVDLSFCLSVCNITQKVMNEL